MIRFLSAPEWRARLRRWLPWLVMSVSLLVLLPVFYIARYNHPCILDDYVNAAWTSFTARQWELYRDWSGRYFNNAAVSLSPLHWHSLSAYRWEVAGVIALLAGSFTAFVVYGLRRFVQAPLRIALAVALASTALLFNNFPSLTEGFYWLTGALTYMLPTVAALGLISIMIRLRSDNAIPRLAWPVAALMAMVAIGGNEVLLVFCDLAVLSAWVHARAAPARLNKQRFYSWLAVVCVICSAVSVLAPGNFIRGAKGPNPLPSVLLLWVRESLILFRNWVGNPMLLLFSIVVGWLLAPFAGRFPRLTLLQAFFLLPAGMLLLFLPAVVGIGIPPPGRVMNQVYVFFLLGWLMFLMVLIRNVQEVPLRAAQRRFARQAGIILLFFSLLVSAHIHDPRDGNFFVASKSLAHRIPQQYDRQWESRYQYMKAATADTVYLKPIQAKAGNLLFMVDVPRWASGSARYFSEYWGRKMAFEDTAQKLK